MSERDILVAGAGVGGLSAALALARAGFEVTILERASALEEAGAGVQLAANATRCLARLGVLDQVAARAVQPAFMRVMDARRGGLLAEAAMGEAAERRFGSPFLVIHRADLQAVLVEAAAAEPRIRLILRSTIEGFSEDHGRVRVAIRRGETPEIFDGAALIGADGLRSAVRGQLFPHALPVFRHRAAWRATAPMARLPAPLADMATRLWLGPGAHLVTYPVRGGRAVNLVAITPDVRMAHGWSHEGEEGELAAHFRGWCAEVQALLAAPGAWLRWAVFDLDPLHAWSTGRVTLLGDAAHAMVPFLAQGAAQAIEDAVVLADCLREDDDIPAALHRYETLRRPRTAQVQAAARGMDRVYHLAGPMAFARNLVIRAKGGAGVLERYRWIYEWPG
ncbi:FAD-dependent monooxygenase [Ancylobacter oerskovii]|uniref:FAD-dependent monooxygenase n=1 Tax=Ancylobacter oerskovii TaxID=459519 RepID=A0ABW4Z199_9HYPH|nr:FAD-dependent monooxygenase [Ancylobacter oerskovii]MBS7542661.1 FAD-dependent monooxygenase [Ancylobacter oerskovii]